MSWFDQIKLEFDQSPFSGLKMYCLSYHGRIMIPVITFGLFNIAYNRLTTALLANRKLYLILVFGSLFCPYSSKVGYHHLDIAMTFMTLLQLFMHISKSIAMNKYKLIIRLIPVLWTPKGFTVVCTCILKKPHNLNIFYRVHTDKIWILLRYISQWCGMFGVNITSHF